MRAVVGWVLNILSQVFYRQPHKTRLSMLEFKEEGGVWLGHLKFRVILQLFKLNSELYSSVA